MEVLAYNMDSAKFSSVYMESQYKTIEKRNATNRALAADLEQIKFKIFVFTKLLEYLKGNKQITIADLIKLPEHKQEAIND